VADHPGAHGSNQLGTGFLRKASGVLLGPAPRRDSCRLFKDDCRSCPGSLERPAVHAGGNGAAVFAPAPLALENPRGDVGVTALRGWWQQTLLSDSCSTSSVGSAAKPLHGKLRLCRGAAHLAPRSVPQGGQWAKDPPGAPLRSAQAGARRWPWRRSHQEARAVVAGPLRELYSRRARSSTVE